MSHAILVRHGATTWTGSRYCGRSDPSLSDTGRSQVAALAAELAAMLPRGTPIVTSPRRRAAETASEIAARLGSPLTVDDRWREVDFGAVEGLTWRELERDFPALAARAGAGDLAIDWPGGETHASLIARVSDAWRSLERGDGDVIVVTHGGPIRAASAWTRGLDEAAAVPKPAGWTRLELTAPASR
jgi:broad specificity phosphatase PhoE